MENAPLNIAKGKVITWKNRLWIKRSTYISICSYHIAISVNEAESIQAVLVFLTHFILQNSYINDPAISLLYYTNLFPVDASSAY